MARLSTELNSLFHTDEQIRQIRGVGNALTDLVEKCLRPLNAGLGVIIVPDKAIAIRCENSNEPVSRAVRLVKRLEADYDDWLLATDKGLLIDDGAQTTPRKLETGVPCKVAAVSMKISAGKADGIFVIARRPDSRDFSAQDQDILSSIAENISKVIQANYDDLTGLINRNEFECLIEQTLKNDKQQPNSNCILHLNLDALQSVCESMGPEAHDEVIRQVALQLQCQLNEVGPVARIGEDEFGVLVKNCAQDLGWFIGEDIRRGISSLDIVWNEQPIKLTTSIGVAKLAADSETVESALAAAKIACISAKDRGRDRVAMYHQRDAMMLNGQHRLQVVQSIQQALRDDHFILFGQPIVPLNARRARPHVEILIRGIDENMDPVPPGKFMSHAEQARLMPEIDRWVVRHTLRVLSKFLVGEKQINGLFAINLSGQSICDDSFMDFVLREFARTMVPPDSICFEVTETAAILNITRAKQFMTAMRDIGCRFALDDFGAGLSSFAYLKTLPLDYLKIDGQFIRGIATDPVSSAIVSAISEMGHAMGLKTIAEYVDGPATKKLLTTLGVDYAQGYGVGEPSSLAEQLIALAKDKDKPKTKKTAARPA